MITSDGLWNTLTIYDETLLFRCMECAALVARDNRDTHQRWHEALRTALTTLHEEAKK